MFAPPDRGGAPPSTSRNTLPPPSGKRRVEPTSSSGRGSAGNSSPPPPTRLTNPARLLRHGNYSLTSPGAPNRPKQAMHGNLIEHLITSRWAITSRAPGPAGHASSRLTHRLLDGSAEASIRRQKRRGSRPPSVRSSPACVERATDPPGEGPFTHPGHEPATPPAPSGSPARRHPGEASRHACGPTASPRERPSAGPHPAVCRTRAARREAPGA